MRGLGFWQIRTVLHLTRLWSAVLQELFDEIVFLIRLLQPLLALLEALRSLDFLDGLLLVQLALVGPPTRALAVSNLGCVGVGWTLTSVIITVLLALCPSLVSSSLVIETDLVGGDVVTGQEICQGGLGTSNRPASACNSLGSLCARGTAGLSRDGLRSGGLNGGDRGGNILSSALGCICCRI